MTPLDRLTEAKETTGATQNWIQNFGYDRYGNRTSFSQNISGNTAAVNPAADPGTNRFNTGQGFVYDKNGNVIQDVDPLTAHTRSFTFNGDNKQIQVTDTTSGQVKGTYFYDGNARRVKKVTETETTIFVYNGMGSLVAEYSTATPPANPTINYTATDQLGSPRLLTDKFGQIVSRRDFLPFGEEPYADGTYRKTADKYSTTGQDAVRQRFTGYQRDTETSLDFAEARYYQNAHGRFTAIDPLLASGKSENPQTFNRYLYVMNNPIRFTDPTGLQVGNHTGAVYYKVAESGAWAFSDRGGKGYNTRYEGRAKTIVGVDGYEYRVRSNGWTQGQKVASGIPVVVASASQGISTDVTIPAQDNTRTLINELGARSEGSMQMIGALSGGAIIGGLTAAPLATAGGFAFAGAVVGEALLAEKGVRQNAEAGQQAAMMRANTNPFQGPIDQPVTVVDGEGNAIRVDTGEQVTGSPDGQYMQVRDKNGLATGVRKDGPHSNHAQFPHAHVPGVLNLDGTEQLKIRVRPK